MQGCPIWVPLLFSRVCCLVVLGVFPSVDRGLFCRRLLTTHSTGAYVIKKTLGITLAVAIGACVLLVTIVLVLQVVLSLVGAE